MLVLVLDEVTAAARWSKTLLLFRNLSLRPRVKRQCGVRYYWLLLAACFILLRVAEHVP